MTEDTSEASREEFITDILEISRIERDKARERYQSTYGGSFQNGKALGKVRAYKNIIKHIDNVWLEDVESGDGE